MSRGEGRFGLQKLISFYKPKTQSSFSSYAIGHLRGMYVREVLKSVNNNILSDIVANRIIIYGLLGLNVWKGLPADIDVVLPFNGSYIFCEVKEKDRSKTPPRGFGIDVPRITEISMITEITGIPCIYIVKEVNNQRERKLIGWWYIPMSQFKYATESVGTIQGGTGMATARSTNHPTKVAPFSEFSRLTEQVVRSGFNASR